MVWLIAFTKGHAADGFDDLCGNLVPAVDDDDDDDDVDDNNVIVVFGAFSCLILGFMENCYN